MEYVVGTRIVLTINKKPPYVHVTIKPRTNRSYTPGAKVMLNQLIQQVEDSFVVPVRILA